MAITLQDEIENCFCDYKTSCDILVTCPTYYIQGEKIHFQLQLSNPIRGVIEYMVVRKDMIVNEHDRIPITRIHKLR